MGGYPRIAGRADGDPRPLSRLHCRVLQVDGSGPQVMHEPIEAFLGTGEKIAGEALIVEPLLSATGKLSLGGGDSGLSTGPKRTSTRRFSIFSGLVEHDAKPDRPCLRKGAAAIMRVRAENAWELNEPPTLRGRRLANEPGGWMSRYRQLDKHRGSRPRCVLMVEGSREDVASRLTRLVDLPDVVVSPDDGWMPYGKPLKREDGKSDQEPANEAQLRGVGKAQSEWSLAGMTHNLLKLWRSGQAPWGWALAPWT